jgi:ribonuclease BN (tRNA processing enzyme)
MKVRVLGCHGGVAPGYRTSCYLVNDLFLIDAGSVATALSNEDQEKIEDIFITHPHLDHIKDLCFLMENTFHKNRKPVKLHSTKTILDHIHAHMFNDILWPDFSKINVGQSPSLEFVPLKEEFEFKGLKITHVPVTHSVTAIGYIVDDGKCQIAFTGDTGPTHRFWQTLSECKNLKGVFTEISFPNAQEKLAKASGHFTTDQLIQDLVKLRQKDVPIYIAHFKPRFFEALNIEFERAKNKRLHLLHLEDEIDFS